jgi:hypothetical protein
VAIERSAAEVVKANWVSHPLLEVGDDAHGEWVAAHVGEVFAEKVGGSAEVAGGRGADYFNVMAFPVHRVAADAAGRRCGDGVEIGDGETEGRIGCDCETQRRDRVDGVRRLLRLAIKGGGRHVGGDDPTVVLDRGIGERWLAAAGGGLFGILLHDYQGGPVA